MNYRQAIKIFWRVTRRHLVQRAEAVIGRNCRKYGDRAKRHTLRCCAQDSPSEAHP